MPILLIFILTASCLPIEWPAPLFGPDPAADGVAVAVPLGLAFALRTWVLRTLRRDPGRRFDVGQGYARLRRPLFFLNLAAAFLAVVGLGWGWAVQHTLVEGGSAASAEFATRATADLVAPRLLPFAELAVPLPYFMLLFGCWLVYYDAERALHRASLTGLTDRPFWSRLGYVWNHLRQLLLLVLLPVVLFVSQETVGRWLPETARSDWYRGASVAAVPLLVLFLPLLLKPLLGLRTLPPGPTRDRLEALARRLRFGYADLLVWPTHGATANAMIVGLLPRVRYVVFTDRLLDEMPPDEVDAVFGHEVGHAKHGHIWYYALFLTLSMAVLAAASVYLDQRLRDASAADPEAFGRYERALKPLAGWQTLPPLVAVAAYVFLMFGFLSRRCERQADVYGCRAVSCGDPACGGHGPGTVFPPAARGLCPTGARTFARALDRVSLLNGAGGPPPGGGRVRGLLGTLAAWLRAWQHAPLPARIGYVLRLADDPTRERAFQRRVFALRWGLILGLAAALVALGQAAGWKNLWAAM